MLHREALPPSTLDLLIELSSRPLLASFSLAGGTSLALRFGHRISVDLDFFTTESFDKEVIGEAITQGYAAKIEQINSAGLSATITGVKVDMVTYRYPLIHAPETIEGVRLLSLPDVAAMKLSAVTNRGAKKDFYDLHTLIEQMGLRNLIDVYQTKYPQHEPMLMLRSLSYFADADEDEDPESLTGTTWEEVQESISAAVREML
jgi:predicted nucleotidyltransferase component of viral defense system